MLRDEAPEKDTYVKGKRREEEIQVSCTKIHLSDREGRQGRGQIVTQETEKRDEQ